MNKSLDVYYEIMGKLRDEGRLRSIPESDRSYAIDLSSNDYLGLAAREDEFDKELSERFPDAGFTSAASRLLSRRGKYHAQLEQLISSLFHRKALIFNSGYHANVGTISSLAQRSTLFLCDKCIHASVIDGLAVGKAEFKRFPHNDIARLEKILEKESESYRRIIVVVESIYSMDGDLAPLEKIVKLKEKYPDLIIYLDEAHAFGVRGEKGLGLAEELGLTDQVDIIVGTLGKALASAGAFVVASDIIIDLLINTSRPFIFSTSLPPVCAARSIIMIEKMLSMDNERKRLSTLSGNLRCGIEKITGKQNNSESQIIPLTTGDAESAVKLASELRANGFDALPIRRPTVPPGTERIRFSLNSSLRDDDISSLLSTLETLLPKFLNK